MFKYARGYYSIGKEIIEEVLESVRLMAEDIANLDGFLIFAGASGGMSGFKSLLLERLSTDYKEQPKIEIAIAPTEEFVVAPYNSVLQFHRSLDYVQSSIIIENQAINTAAKFNGLYKNMSYKNMNKLIADGLNYITRTFRYESKINTSIKELTENLSVFPRLHYYSVSYSHMNPKNYFSSYSKLRKYLYEKKVQLSQIDIRHGKYISNSFVHMGKEISESELNESIAREKEPKQSNLRPDCRGKFTAGFSKHPCKKLSGCMITSSTAITEVFKTLEPRFDLMYAKRAFVHSYTSEGMEQSEFSDAREGITALIKDYEGVDS